ncbi:endolytic transglycosylase MltG [Nitratifractor salsuginis]|uniref:Endolytic murein transglycosylase n=1 Tax=Nitratifractor salsuginis (strain DSM 16511 / JCM 12458 / E9I37-1) TaxID=749222 RepID=E6X1E7_NITSE|nr:endolytic transglycosylase MltG [Nitratifractor salsuginis]ADV45880.1 aminodeoxychorismate lyase [Nitratifractor salsuginis DSM 16511]
MKRFKWLIGIVALIFLALLGFYLYHTRSTHPIHPPAAASTKPSPSRPKPESPNQGNPSTPQAPPRHSASRQELPPVSPARLREFDQPETLPPLIHIPQGDRTKIYDSLRRQGLPLWISDLLFLLPSRVTPGWIRLQHPVSLQEFFSRINDFPREKTRRVVMYSGDSLEDFIRQLSRQARLDPKALYEEYFRFSPYLDGGILAGYYRLPYRLSPGPAMAYLTEKSEETFRKLSEQYLGRYDPAEFRRYLIIASIIQRETWHPEEMPRIAAVIYNRLKRNMKLQLDATLNYGPWSHKKVTPERIRRDKSRFNTYRHHGLPPSPLGSVTPAALKAALAPAKSGDLYFVKGPNGRHLFSASYADHLRIISRLKALHSPAPVKKSEGNETNSSAQIGYNLLQTNPKNLDKNGTP